MTRSPSPCRLNGPYTCPPALAGSTGYALQWPQELEVCTRCFVGDLWCLERVSHLEVPSPSLCIAYTGHISHPSAYPISGGGSRGTRILARKCSRICLKKTPTCLPRNRLVVEPIAHCLPALTFPREKVRSAVHAVVTGVTSSVRLFPHRSCHHSVPRRPLHPLSRCYCLPLLW